MYGYQYTRRWQTKGLYQFNLIHLAVTPTYRFLLRLQNNNFTKKCEKVVIIVCGFFYHDVLRHVVRLVVINGSVRAEKKNGFKVFG